MYFLIELLRDLKADILPDGYYLKNIFKKHLGYHLNLSQPKTLNEKLQWLKINYKDPLLTICADKLAVREYISDNIGSEYLIPLVGVVHDPRDLKTFDFPEYPCIVKANHDSGGYFIIKNHLNIDRNELVKQASMWLKNNHAKRTKEWQYKDIKPVIIIEKLMMDSNNRIPNDIKFSCFNGRAELVHVDSNKEIKHLRNNYSRDFIPLPINWPAEYLRNDVQPKPLSFDKARNLAEKLASRFPFVRVDFYLIDGDIYFGELTFHPTSGFGRFSPKYYDFKYGSKLRLPVD